MKRHIQLLVLLAAVAAGAALLFAQGQGKAKQGQRPLGTEDGFGVFQTRCMGCHGNPNVAQAPSPNAIREMSPERIYEALTTGKMKSQGEPLTDEQKRMTALFLSGRPLGSAQEGDAKSMPNHCASNPPMSDPASGPGWNGWGAGVGNTRFQTAQAGGLTAAQVPQLKLKWAFGYPTGVSSFGQPAVVAGRVFVGTDVGYIYSLDAKTGCVYWSYQTQGSVRTAISVGAVQGRGATKYGVYFGDAHANVYGIDAQTGAQMWTSHVDDHFVARITGAPTVFEGRVYAPVSSSEEWQGSNLDYPCCTSRGSVVALNASTGERVWKTFVIPEAPKPTRKNSKGVQQYAPAGASVWNSPTIDTVRRAIYFGTGDAETEPAAKTSDAIMALDLATGKELWHYQAQANDAFMGGCNGATKTDNCPSVQGPDLDIGNSPILKTLPNGKRVVVAATKNGDVIALDPDHQGALVWRVSATKGRGGNFGGMVWGGGADDQNLYYGLSSGGMVAVQLTTGERVWFSQFIPEGGPRVSNAAATTVIPGAALVGGTDGKLRALAVADGKSLWEFDTAKEFPTVNQVKAHGGSIGSNGPVVAGGMLFIGSGYGVTAGLTGNVLLAFGL